MKRRALIAGQSRVHGSWHGECRRRQAGNSPGMSHGMASAAATDAPLDTPPIEATN